jgi:hypothetical protein
MLLRSNALLVVLFFVSFGIACGGGGSHGGPPPSENPVPTVTGVTPNSATAGSAALTITVSGSSFIGASVIEWNNTPLTTSYASSTSLSGQVLASDLTSPGTASVTVQNPSPGGGASTPISFSVNSPSTTLTILDLPGSDIVWNPSQQKLYVAVPNSASSSANTVTVVDPIAGLIVSSQLLNSAPSGLAISDDSQFLYAVVSSGSTIQRFSLPALAPDIQWSLGTDAMFAFQNLAGDIKVQPGAAHTLAVSFGQYGSGSVAVFDDGVRRSGVGGGGAVTVGNSLQWKADGTELYAAYTQGSDSAYYTTVSDDALFTMPVTQNGIGNVTTYDSSFREEGAHLRSDPNTGYVYGDWGEVINAENGIPVGNYRWSRPYSSFFPGPLSIVDPSLKRVYTLFEVSDSNGIPAFRIQSFDQTQFQLLSTIVIPNAAGVPTNFIRWGQSGLALVTSGPSGKLYILDGSFVNASATLDTAAGTPLTPVPALSAISPITATVGGGGIRLTVTGRDFSTQSAVYWNGKALPTTMVNNTELSVQVPASDLASVSLVAITATNSGTAFPASNSLPFSVNPAPVAGNQIAVYSTGGNDLAWDSSAARIYVSMPGIQGDSGDSIAVVDPVAGTVTNTGFLGSDPARLSISDNMQYLYVALYGQNSIEQLSLPSFQVSSSWNVGGVGTFFGPYYALDIQAAPGVPQTTALVAAAFGVSPSAMQVAINDNSTPRASVLPVAAYPYSSLQWAGTNTTLYAVDQGIPQDFLVLDVGASGAVLNQHYDSVLNTYSERIHYDAGAGLVYTDAGQAVQPTSGTVVGSYGASGIAVPDSNLGEVFILGQTAAQVSTSSYTIESFDQAKYTALSSITIDNVVGTPTAFIRWGTNGLAFTTRVGMPWDFNGTGAGQLYVISGSFVKSAKSSNESERIEPLLPVHRTWDSKLASAVRQRGAIVHRSPFIP